jgi:1,4-dihydroxy-6-naphthoate synthase
MQKTKIRLGFSPCPNDCFMFDALVHGKIDTKYLAIEPVIEDVETLNRMAFAGELDVTKLSYHAFAYVSSAYQLLTAGSALGFSCGPLLVGLPATIRQLRETPGAIADMKVAIPGKYTTANFLLSLAYPQLKEKKEMVFSEIEQAVLGGSAQLGLIIHENRFTYRQKGLEKLADLGEWWEKESGHAIPLGGIAVLRSLPLAERRLINELVRGSVSFAFANPESVMDFVRKHAQEMDDEVMRQHIALYVNEYSVDLGVTGRKAVQELFSRAVQEKIIAALPAALFVQ